MFHQTALDDFIQTAVTRDDLSNTLLPSMQKALLRSPEVSLDGKAWCLQSFMSL